MKIKEIMEKPVFIPESATKKQIHAIVKKHRNMQIFIVTDKNRRFLGDIHENDLFYMMIPNEMYDEIGAELAFDMEKKFFADTAKEIMRKHDVTCSPDDEFMAVALKLASVENTEMPVVNKKGKVVGIITEGIMLRNMK